LGDIEALFLARFLGQPCHGDQDHQIAFAIGSIDISQGLANFVVR
jgi:hypothetical protein